MRRHLPKTLTAILLLGTTSISATSAIASIAAETHLNPPAVEMKESELGPVHPEQAAALGYLLNSSGVSGPADRIQETIKPKIDFIPLRYQRDRPKFSSTPSRPRGLGSARKRGIAGVRNRRK